MNDRQKKAFGQKTSDIYRLVGYIDVILLEKHHPVCEDCIFSKMSDNEEDMFCVKNTPAIGDKGTAVWPIISELHEAVCGEGMWLVHNRELREAGKL